MIQFDYGYMGSSGPLKPVCFIAGVDTSSGAMTCVQLPENKKEIKDEEDYTSPYVIECLSRWLRDLGYTRFVLHGDKERVLQKLLDHVAKQCVPPNAQWQVLRQASPTQSHQSSGAAEKAIQTMRGLARTYLGTLKEKFPKVEFNASSPIMPWLLRHW